MSTFTAALLIPALLTALIIGGYLAHLADAHLPWVRQAIEAGMDAGEDE